MKGGVSGTQSDQRKTKVMDPMASAKEALENRWKPGEYGLCFGCNIMVTASDNNCFVCEPPKTFKEIDDYWKKQSVKLLQGIQTQVDAKAAAAAAPSVSSRNISRFKEDWTSKPTGEGAPSYPVWNAFKDFVKPKYDNDKNHWDESVMGKTPWECMLLFVDNTYCTYSGRKSELIEPIKNAKTSEELFKILKTMIETGDPP